MNSDWRSAPSSATFALSAFGSELSFMNSPLTWE